MGSNLHAKKIHVDFTVTSTTGCTFHIVGELDVDIKIPLSSSTISGFNGSIPIGGASGCPGGTFEVNFGYVVSTGGAALDPEEKDYAKQLLWEELVQRGIIDAIGG